jgi:hypothetical protein
MLSAQVVATEQQPCVSLSFNFAYCLHLLADTNANWLSPKPAQSIEGIGFTDRRYNLS